MKRLKKCAYCGKDVKKSNEHIISDGVLELFPECFVTIDEHRGITYAADPKINDTCSECNSTLSYIDTFGINFISEYFTGKYEEETSIRIEYEYTMLQKMFLKYAFNDIRKNKSDASFFDEKIIEFIKKKELSKPLDNISIFGGLSVNQTSTPDCWFGNMKLLWCESPKFITNSFFINNQDKDCLEIRENLEFADFDGLLLSYMFRFNSGQFVLLCWDNDDKNRLENLDIINRYYSYTQMNVSNVSNIYRCTNLITYRNFGYVTTNFEDREIDYIAKEFDEALKDKIELLDEINKKFEKLELQIAKEKSRKK